MIKYKEKMKKKKEFKLENQHMIKLNWLRKFKIIKK
jgi:hypothetical protein